MTFSFVFFFERSMLIPLKIPTGSIQDKEIEYFTFSYLHGSCLFILWSHCGFCNKKRNIWDFYRIWPFPNAVELDSRHPHSSQLRLIPYLHHWGREADSPEVCRLPASAPSKNWMGKWRFDSGFKGENENVCRYKCFQC